MHLGVFFNYLYTTFYLDIEYNFYHWLSRTLKYYHYIGSDTTIPNVSEMAKLYSQAYLSDQIAY